jgi:hypothetical protein
VFQLLQLRSYHGETFKSHKGLFTLGAVSRSNSPTNNASISTCSKAVYVSIAYFPGEHFRED